jgi:hypothetical protein
VAPPGLRAFTSLRTAPTCSQIARKALSAIKRTGHHRTNKPYTSVSVGAANAEVARQIVGEHGTKHSDTKRMIRWTLTPEEAEAWLPTLPPVITPVHYIGHVRFAAFLPSPFCRQVWVLKGETGVPEVRADARVDSVEVGFGA